MRAKAYVDGGCRKKYDVAGVGVMLVINGVEWEWIKGFHPWITNNEAEYEAVKLAVKKASDMEVDSLTIYCDSQLIVNQLTDEWSVKEERMQRYKDEIHELALEADFEELFIEWIPREQNRKADKLANRAMDDLLATQ